MFSGNKDSGICFSHPLCRLYIRVNLALSLMQYQRYLLALKVKLKMKLFLWLAFGYKQLINFEM